MNGDKDKFVVIRMQDEFAVSGVLVFDLKWREKFKYLVTTSTNQNYIKEEIKCRLKSVMLAIVWCRIICLPVCYPRI